MNRDRIHVTFDGRLIKLAYGGEMGQFPPREFFKKIIFALISFSSLNCALFSLRHLPPYFFELFLCPPNL